MIHTVKIDDSTLAGKQILQSIRLHTKKANHGIFIENTLQSGSAPEGYLTIEEFRNIALEDTKKFCQENGIS